MGKAQYMLARTRAARLAAGNRYVGPSISCCFYTEILCKAVHRLTLLTWVFPTDFKQRLIENLRFEAKKSAAVELFD